MKKVLFVLLISITHGITAQNAICINEAVEHKIHSKHLEEERTHWVSLPLNYADSLQYPVIYVFDAEWRFDLVRHMAFELGAWDKINKSIVVGIPHLDWEYQRGIDLTFSQSRIEYDGDAVDSTWYNSTNSGGGMRFYAYLTEELIPSINKHYSTNDHETLIGHSYGGYFGAYLLSMDHPFEVIHSYDPSIWYSDGEVIDRFKKTVYDRPTRIHLTYQSEPAFHRMKIEQLIKELEKNGSIILTSQFYGGESHNSLFMDSFYQGIVQTNK